MNAVREFRREDIQEVAALWLRIFRRSSAHPPKILQDYFREILFESPWADPELPSLVCEDGEHGIVGFLGVMPRRMTYHGRPLRAAVATQLMVDPAARNYPAVKLMRRFLGGRQDLSYSDGANDDSERLWRACGGDVARFHSLAWTRVLRPFEYARSLVVARKRVLGAVAGMLWPVTEMLDAITPWTSPGARWLPRQSDLAVEADPSDETLLWCIQNLGGGRALTPCYDVDTLRWLVRRAGERQRYGPLRKAVVRGAGGEVAGWYLYYLQPGAVAQVLQFGARAGAVSKVLNSLFYRARVQGATAVSGGMEAQFTKEIAAGRCGFAWPGCAVVVHSRHRDILNAVHRGDAFLSRLEGEWWARFSDPSWIPRDPAPWAQAAQAVVAPLQMNIYQRGERT